MNRRIGLVFWIIATAARCGERNAHDTFAVPLPSWRQAAESGAARLAEKDNPSDRRREEEIASDSSLLAAEGERRGLAKSYGVQRALRIAIVDRLVDDDFRVNADPSKLTEDDLLYAYKRNHWLFNRPAFVSVAHILFRVDDPKRREEQFDLSQKLCGEGVAEAKRVNSADAFRALEKKFAGRGLKVSLEEFRTWPGKMEKPFEEAAFKLRTPGQVSDCVTSHYGTHIIYLFEYEPPVERPLASVREEVRKKSSEEFAVHKFALWLKKLRATHRASLVPDVIARLRQEPVR